MTSAPSTQTSLAPRGAETWRLYAVMGIGSFVVNGLGAVLLPLQADLGVDYASVALYPTVYSLSTIAVGLVGAPLARRLGHTRLLIVSLALLIAGAALFWLPSRPATLVGALVLGLGTACMLQVVPGRLSQLYGTRTDIAMSEANSAASFSAIAPALLVGAVLGLGITWRFGFLAPILAAGLVLLISTLRHQPDDDRPAPAPLAATHGTGAWLVPFVGAILVVSSEFALVFWSASVTSERFAVDDSVAVITMGALISGIAIGRLFGRGVISRLTPYAAAMSAIAVALAGFITFFASPVYPVAVLGLFVNGLGLSIVYPILATRILAAFPGNTERGSQLTVLAIGTSTGLSPLLLGVLAGQMELHLATLIVPVYLVTLAVLLTLRRI